MAKPDKTKPVDAKGEQSPPVPPATLPALQSVAEGDGIEKDIINVPMVMGDDGVLRGSATVDGDESGTPLDLLPCSKCTSERPCSVECWVKAGNAASEFDAFIARLDAPAKAALVALPPATGKRRYKVWPHGDLQRDGVTYKPGDELELTEDVAKTIPCLVSVE